MTPDFESFICGALLHDIGKFIQRGYAQREAKHWEVSEWFINENDKMFADPSLVKAIVGHHHEGFYTPQADRPSALSDTRHRIMAYLVSRADNFSSAERSADDAETSFSPGAMLDSIFSQIDIGRGLCNVPDGKSYKYKLATMFDDLAYPELRSSSDLLTESELQNHFDKFLSEFKGLFQRYYERSSDTLAYLLRKYLWCLPSDTTKSPHDVSLADHLCTTAAIASCFYKWHEEYGWDEDKAKDDSISKVQLFCGDLSGIQKYIYGIASVGVGGVAKRLRGRSFRVSLLTDAIALRILWELDLPVVCRVMSAGGQFYLLLPNTENCNSLLKKAISGIEKWLLEEFKGEIAFSFGLTALEKNDFGQDKFFTVLSEIKQKTAAAKQSKFLAVLKEGAKVFDLHYEGRSACPICGVRPEKDSSASEHECDDCEEDRKLGQKLASQNDWLVLSKKPFKDCWSLFAEDKWYAGIVNDAYFTSEDFEPSSVVLACSLKNGKLSEGIPSGYLLYTGYVPRWKNAKELQSVKNWEKLPDAEDLSQRPEDFETGEAIKSFSALAQLSEGAKMLGVLRADVDYLGFVFGLGLGKKASISRIATMSSLMNLFFSRQLEKILEEQFPNTYTAYSGGDDLMLFGPWSDIVKLAKVIRDNFISFTCNNPRSTLSAGIANFQASTPVAISSVLTGEVLEQAKSSGRDAIAFFGSTVKWSQFDSVEQWMKKLYAAASREEHSLSTGFIYDLLLYKEMAGKYFHDGDVASAMYRPYLTYNISRNLSNEKIKDISELKEVRDQVVELIGANMDQWEAVAPAASWCLYLLRNTN